MKNRLSPALIGLLVVSLLGNVLLGVRLIQSKTRSAPPVSTNSLQAIAVAPTRLPAPTETPLSFNLTPYAALGSFTAESNHIPWLHWTEEQFAAFQKGLRASFDGRNFPMDEEAIKLRDEISAKVQSMLKEKQPDPIEAYFKNLREKENVQRTASGLHFRITQKGSGTSPDSKSNVVVSYSARLPGGEAVQSLSRPRVHSRVSDLLPGLAEGVQLLSPGAKALIYVPPALSFGEHPWPPDVPKGAPIIFFVELHDVTPDTAE